MNMLRHKRSTTVINTLIAIVITLAVNFSYILVMIAEQRESSSSTNISSQPMSRPHIEIEGVLHLSPDGYGYIISEQVTTLDMPEMAEPLQIDSVFVSNRKVWSYRLQDGDKIRCTIHPPHPSQVNANPSLNEVIVQNGNEIPAPPVYDRPRRNQDMTWQMLYYFTLTLLLLTVMTARFDVNNFTTRRYLIRCVIAIAAAFACYFFAPFINWKLGGRVMMIFQNEPKIMVDYLVIMKCLVAVIVAILYGRIYGMLFEQQKMQLENERLRNENLQTQYNLLMGQISPHFFFNSLNSLSMLVRDNNEEKALAYIDQLSYTFRYIIQNGQNTRTTLAEEMEFTHAYGELFKVRYADKLFFDIEIDSQYLSWTLPALTMQPLIGNAVKHNAITRKHPFHISIRTEDSTLVVSNVKSPKLEPEPSTGIGLKNLRSRWQLITGRDIEIKDTDTEFIVRLPLQRPDGQ
ncbi:MAG: histidine kinase [Alistipes sp.]|nr:histidine kinase [Alistipes sp.]